MLDRVWRKGNPQRCWWEYNLLYHCGKQYGGSSKKKKEKKRKIELLYDPAVPLLGIYLGKTLIQKDTRTPVFIVALFKIAKT